MLLSDPSLIISSRPFNADLEAGRIILSQIKLISPTQLTTKSLSLVHDKLHVTAIQAYLTPIVGCEYEAAG